MSGRDIHFKSQSASNFVPHFLQAISTGRPVQVHESSTPEHGPTRTALRLIARGLASDCGYNFKEHQFEMIVMDWQARAEKAESQLATIKAETLDRVEADVETIKALYPKNKYTTIGFKDFKAKVKSAISKIRGEV